MPFPWPTTLRARAVTAELRGFARSGGRSLLGTEQRVYADVGRWEFTLDQVQIRTPDQANAWRATVARLRGGEVVVLAVFNPNNPAPALRGYADFTVAANVALRGNVVSLSGHGAIPQAGQDFSIGDRLYRIVEVISSAQGSSIADWLTSGEPWSDAGVWADNETDGPSLTQVRVMPGMREAVSAGAVARFSGLTCLCILRDVGDGDLALDLGRFGQPGISFVESF